jgi:hypothetical protein
MVQVVRFAGRDSPDIPWCLDAGHADQAAREAVAQPGKALDDR